MSERTATRRRKSSSKPKKPVPVTRKATFVAGWDLAPNVPDTKLHGTANPVTRTTLNSATLIKGGPTVYFKARGEATRSSRWPRPGSPEPSAWKMSSRTTPSRT